MTLQTPSAAAEWWLGARPWRDAVGARRLPRHRLGRRLPHHRQGSPLLRQDHLVHCPLPLLCHVHPARSCPHLARYITDPKISRIEPNFVFRSVRWPLVLRARGLVEAVGRRDVDRRSDSDLLRLQCWHGSPACLGQLQQVPP